MKNHREGRTRRGKWVRLSSPLVALGALVLGVGGNATAAVLITGADIKDNTVGSVDVRDGTIRSADVDNGALRGADVANNSLTGADVKESSLAKVPSAASATNAQNAGTVDGVNANALTRVARMGTGETLVLTSEEQTYGSTLSLVAPRAGFVMIHANVTIANPSCTTSCGAYTRIRHIQSDTFSVPAMESIASGQPYANTSHAWVFPVTAGVNTFDIRIARIGGNGVMTGHFAELAAIFSPFGSNGAGTLAASEATAATKALDAE